MCKTDPSCDALKENVRSCELLAFSAHSTKSGPEHGKPRHGPTPLVALMRFDRSIEKRASLTARTVLRRWSGTFRFTRRRAGGIPAGQATAAREVQQCCRETAKTVRSSAKLPRVEAH